MKTSIAFSLLVLFVIGGFQETTGADLKSAVIGDWKLANGSLVRLNANGSFRKDNSGGTYTFVSDSVVRFEYHDGARGNDIKTRRGFCAIKMLNDSAMSVESAVDSSFSTKQMLRLRRPTRIEQNRKALIGDLTMLAAKSQQYYQIPSSLGGGGNSFAGLTADLAGIAVLANIEFSNNINGSYSIATAGNADSVVIRGVGKVSLENGKFPTYDILVKPAATEVQKIY